MSTNQASTQRPVSATSLPPPDVEQGIGPRDEAQSHEVSEKASRLRGTKIERLPMLSEQNKEEIQAFWDRFKGKGRKNVGILTSLKNIVLSSWLNLLLVIIPIAWASHFVAVNDHEHEGRGWGHSTTFVLCFLALMPLEQLFDWGGEQMSLYLGKDLGDLLMVTLNNAVEATLAIILLIRCELKLLQSTLVGVILLHLLLVPGMSFLTHGARIWEQELHPHQTELNQSLLTVGCMALLVPAAFFAALDRGPGADIGTPESIVNDTMRGHFLKMSRGVAIILLVIYIASRIFLHNPPGEDNALRVHPDAPEEIKQQEWHLAHAEPEVNQYVCIALLVVAVAIMAFTAEMLVESIEFVREQGNIEEEWFGLVLLPIVSFAADGAIAIGYFASLLLQMVFGTPLPPSSLAKARAIDLSIQFVLFWMPFVVLLGWWTNKPMSLLFDFFEVAVLLGSCFLVNYVTADKKTNWVEGLIMVSFYLIIVLCAWFYPGQLEIDDMHACRESVAAFVAAGGAEGEGAAASEAAGEHVVRALNAIMSF